MSNYKTYRDFHLWVGLVLLVPVSVIAITGFLWNHEKSLGIKQDYGKTKVEKTAEAKPAKKKQQPSSEVAGGTLHATPGIWQQHAGSIEAAMLASQEEWGADVPLERIELRQEPGYGLVVKVKALDLPAMQPNEIVWSVGEAGIIDRKGGLKTAEGKTDWAKVVHDLHTGKFFSKQYGFLWSDGAAMAIVLLGFTGVVLYLIPIFKKRSNKKKKAVAASIAGAVKPTPAAPSDLIA